MSRDLAHGIFDRTVLPKYLSRSRDLFWLVLLSPEQPNEEVPLNLRASFESVYQNDVLLPAAHVGKNGLTEARFVAHEVQDVVLHLVRDPELLAELVGERDLSLGRSSDYRAAYTWGAEHRSGLEPDHPFILGLGELRALRELEVEEFSHGCRATGFPEDVEELGEAAAPQVS